ncbi:MAG TPA: PPC domain-containing protein, partial [Candidatus Thermoplasmatota archaeon]|nr:PPC domain-containing protein [Candidatus Thermoplasmatota archaeon]
MNKTILTIGVALIMLGVPASAKFSSEETKAELGNELGVSNASCPLGAGVHTITSGQSISSSLPNVAGASCEFSFTPPAGADLGRLVLSGMQSDFDLYVKRNGIPTTTSWDCRPYSGGTTVETCDVGVSDGDFLGVMVLRWSGSGTFTLTASTLSVPSLENGVPVQIQLAGSGTFALYKLVVPQGATS